MKAWWRRVVVLRETGVGTTTSVDGESHVIDDAILVEACPGVHPPCWPFQVVGCRGLASRQTAHTVLHGYGLRTHIPPGWGQQAACAPKRVDPDWWFTPPDDELQVVARNVCGSCPVRRSCLAHALATDEPDGIWGGFDESERAWLRLALSEGTRVAAILDPHTRTAAA